MMVYNPKYGNYRTRTLADIIPTFEDLLALRTQLSPICPSSVVSDEKMEIIYYLLYGKYGESHVASVNEEQFCILLISKIGSCAPAFLKHLEMQQSLASMSLNDILDGPTNIINHASNPNTSPSTQTLNEMTYIDSQTVTRVKRNKLDGYANLMALLDTDIYGAFLNNFQSLFQRIVIPQAPLWYENEIKEEDEEDD